MRHRQNASLILGVVGLATISLAILPSSRAFDGGGSARAATQESVQDRDRYMREMTPQVEQWRQRVEAFASRALDAGTPEALAVRERILSEWSLVETTWHFLGVSYGTAWEEAQVSFQQATDSFTRTWHEQVTDEF